jgi:hypothetical protein
LSNQSTTPKTSQPPTDPIKHFSKMLLTSRVTSRVTLNVIFRQPSDNLQTIIRQSSEKPLTKITGTIIDIAGIINVDIN